MDMEGGDYYGGTIYSMGTIEADTTVLFMAEDTVVLQSGFHAKAGSDFTAMIGACQEQLVTEAQELAEARIATPKEPILKNELGVRPNPFQQSTMIDFELASPQQVRLALYSMGGQQLMLLKEGYMEKGIHQQTLQANSLKGGMYLIVLQSETATLTKKVILIK